MKPELQIVQTTRETLLALGKTRGPIIVGPWLSEIGFELLYWIPFLRWARSFAGIPREDLWVVSRGGCRSWYADISPNYIDVFQFYSPDRFRQGNDKRMADQAVQQLAIGMKHGRPSTKQNVVTQFDRDILKHATRAAGLSEYRLIHPSMMYGLFRPFWQRKLPNLYKQMTSPKRLVPPDNDLSLPKSFVAAKFYNSAACAKNPIHSQMVNDIVRTVAASTDVVLLHAGTQYDDHGEFSVNPHPRVHRVPMDPVTNLETQTAVVARAKSFIGTYGGFAYLAPFLGVRAQTYYARPNFRRDHRQVIDQVSTQLRAPFSVELIGGGSGHVAA
jgi:hypothetical protein